MNVEVGLAVFVIAVKGGLRGYREEHLVSSYTTRKMRTAPVETFKATRPTSTTPNHAQKEILRNPKKSALLPLG